MSAESEKILREAQGRRLRDARQAAGYGSARSAALESGWPESTYRAHEAGTRTMGVDDAERYARRFRSMGAGGVTGQTILYGTPNDRTLSLDEISAKFDPVGVEIFEMALARLLNSETAGKEAAKVLLSELASRKFSQADPHRPKSIDPTLTPGFERPKRR